MTLTQITEKGIKDGEIVNADINASAAIAKSKLASLDIVNGDINASAAIVGTKISPDFGSQDIVTTGHVGVGTASPLSGAKLTVASQCLAITGQNTAHSANSLRLGEEGSGLAQLRAYGPDTSNAGSFQFTTSNSNGTGGSTNALRITADGKIGIGTTSPNQLLEVANSSGGATISISTDQQPGSVASKKYNNLDFTGYNNIVMARIQSWDESSSTGQGFLTFHTHLHNTGLQEHLRIMNDGKIGIGSTSPNQKLHISGGGIQLDDGWNTQWGGNTDRAYVQGTSGSNGELFFATNNGRKMTIFGNGAVGIGTTSVGTGTVTIKGTTNAYGGVGNATVSVGAALQLEDDQGRRVSFWAPKSGEGAIGSITNHDFVIVTGNTEKARFSNNTGNFSIADGDLKFSTAGHGIDFSATSDLSSSPNELFNDYEVGTWTPSLNKAGATGNADGSVGSRAGFYVKSGSMLWISFYWYSADLSFGTGSNAWYIANVPHNLIHNINSAYQFIPGGYLYQNAHTGVSYQAGYRWQSNNANGANTLTMYGQGNTTNASGGAYEFSGCGVLRTT